MRDQTEPRVFSGHLFGPLRGGLMGGAPHPQRRRSPGKAWASVLAASLALAGLSVAGIAVADVRTIAGDTLRTGWDQNQPTLSPSAVASSNFGKLFSAAVDGQVY